MAGIGAFYLLGYLPLRFTHTEYEINKTTDERAPYTMFDANSRVDVALYHLYWPVVRMDHLLTGRRADIDKW